jgi:16S rRNA (uracil1498-N3)-methyltransferase
MPVYFVQSEQIHDGKIRITGDLAHHIRDVLRVRAGETLTLVDENRRRYRVALESVAPDRLTGGILDVSEPAAVSSLRLILAQAILKKPKMDWVIQKATELGVEEIIPLITERTVVRPQGERFTHQRDRWRKIATEAAQQCGRPDIPEVSDAADWSRPDAPALAADKKIVLWEAEAKRPLRDGLTFDRPVGSLLLAVGPEGGFSAEEVRRARESGFEVSTLGGRILRSETAVIAALTIVQYELGDLA